MKINRKILIITSHYPPSNLAGVHRSRLFARHLPLFGWEPIILTVDEKYYEEALDRDLEKLLPAGQKVYRASAMPVTKPRLIGDLGLRAFYPLRKKAVRIIKDEGVDFIYIPIPSFYLSLLGPYLHKQTGVPYGIDYIDPWVHHFPGAERRFSRHWWSTKLSRYLEPRAVRKASLVTGVAEGYYQGVKDRNPRLQETCLFGAMPYGGEKEDHVAVKKWGSHPYLFSQKGQKCRLVYAGALLPKAYEPLEAILSAISTNREQFSDVEFHFIGTGKTPNDSQSYSIKPLAEKYGVWKTVVFEYPARIPYLDVLVHLEAADGVFILGSTEPHYTPSKVYQAILSGKPILAVLHQQSKAFALVNRAGAGITVELTGEHTPDLSQKFLQRFEVFRQFGESFRPVSVNEATLSEFSAFEVTRKLASLLDQVVTSRKS